MTLGPLDGAAHGYEVPFSFHNYDGLGDERGNDSVTWPQLSTMMSRMWVSFINHLDPNYSNSEWFAPPTSAHCFRSLRVRKDADTLLC